MSDHVHLYNRLVSSLPKEAVDPKIGMSKPQLEEVIKTSSKAVVKKARHVSCAKKAQDLMQALERTARKHMRQISGRWFISQ